MTFLPPQHLAGTGSADGLFGYVKLFLETAIAPFFSMTWGGVFLVLCVSLTIGFFAWGWIRRGI